MNNGSVVFERPDLTGASPVRRQPQSFLQQVGDVRQQQLYIENGNARSRTGNLVWQARLDEVERVAGVRLPHPEGYIDEVDPAFMDRLIQDGRGPYDPGVQEELLEARRAYVENRIGELRDSRPEYASRIADAEEWRGRRNEFAQDVAAEASDAGFWAGLTGGALGAFEDPVNIYTLPFGGGKTILGAAAREAGLNALLEAVNIPVASRYRQELGLEEISAEDAVIRVAAGGVFGGVVGGGQRALAEGWSRMPMRRRARALRDLAPDDEDAQLLADLLDETAEARDAVPFEGGAGAEAEHASRLTAALEALASEPERASEALVRLDDETDLPRRPVADDTAGLQSFDPQELGVDAARFQFKDGGDAQGVTSRLRDVEEWDEVRAGIVVVWEDGAGQRWIVDGHQRRGLAARLQAQAPETRVRLNGFLYREADGVSDMEVRAIAAAKNLAEGTGSAIDAAKVLRADPDLLDASLPRSSALIRDAQGLMRLDEEAFGVIVNEVVPAHYGAIVGRLIGDASEQMAVLQLLARLEPASAFEAEALVRQALAAGFRKSQGETADMFGGAPREALFADRAKILARANRILRNDSRVFSTLEREADRIEGAGNRLARDSNRQRAQDDRTLNAILQSLAHRKGPVSDALNEAAERADGNLAGAAREFVGNLRRLVESGDIEGGGPGPAGRNAAADDAGDAAPEPDGQESFLIEGADGEARPKSRNEIEAELDAEDAAVERLRGCVPKG